MIIRRAPPPSSPRWRAGGLPAHRSPRSPGERGPTPAAAHASPARTGGRQPDHSIRQAKHRPIYLLVVVRVALTSLHPSPPLPVPASRHPPRGIRSVSHRGGCRRGGRYSLLLPLRTRTAHCSSFSSHSLPCSCGEPPGTLSKGSFHPTALAPNDSPCREVKHRVTGNQAPESVSDLAHALSSRLPLLLVTMAEGLRLGLSAFLDNKGHIEVG